MDQNDGTAPAAERPTATRRRTPARGVAAQPVTATGPATSAATVPVAPSRAAPDTLPATILPEPLTLFADAIDYWVDSAQRNVLFWDVLRRRGNQFLATRKAGNPPVLKFDYEMVMDGRTLTRPVNYALVRIIPDPGMTIDPEKRPYVVVDPRAGHGPGIGGSKKDSQIGVALRAGHPVYFVMFFPEPMPGQTIPDVANAEALFLEEVARRHPGRAGKPVVIGNCQAGWAVAMLSAARPDVTGPIVMNGAPMSYWAGREGKNPMRYSGGILGGTWLASLAGDLGNGVFDGANLVQNFENLNPANTLWSKQYNLYSKIDTEAERYLDFEKWWGGFFLMNKEEMEFIVQNLFVGNRLETGGVKMGDAGAVNLRNIRSPIVIFASDGDNITPPQQALNWICDAYASADDIKANGQTIVYLLHKDIGHLGIFVSGKVAQREHTEIVSVLDHIEMLPPGLYEMMIENYDEETAALDPLKSQHRVRFEERTLADILALDDGRADEANFASVAKLSALNEQTYRQFVSPVVRAFSSDLTARMLREAHPLRAQRTAISDLNPFLWPLQGLATLARTFRRPVREDNPFVKLERNISGAIENTLNAYRDSRDSAAEQLFKVIYGPLGLEMMMAHLIGEAAANPDAAPQRIAPSPEEVQATRERLLAKVAEGGFVEALVRIIAAVLLADHAADRREFVAGAEILRNSPKLQDLTMADYHRLFTEQSFILQADREKALAALATLLPSQQDRMDAMIAAQSIALADLELTDEERTVLQTIARVLEV